MALRILLAVTMLLMGGCYYTPAPVSSREAPRHAAGSRGAYAVYNVRPGDTMYSIAKRFGISYKLLARRNRIGYPYTIYVGQELFLTHMAPPSENIPTPSEATVSRRGRSAPQRVDVSPPDRGYAHIRLIWPVTGTITSDFGNRGHRMHDGIDIAAPRGTPVRAAAAGEVVYSDNRLSGYGRLIIIRHTGDLFTAYAHNQRNLVARGDKVKQGEIIARVGQTGRASGPHLHFEVRRGPTPVNPLVYLPRR